MATAIHTKLNSKIYHLKNIENIKKSSCVECIVTRVNSEHRKAFIIVCIYRPPKYDRNTIKSDMDAISLICDELSKTGKLFILTGDFNLKYDWCYSMLEHIMKSYNLKQIVSEPTRGNTMLDLIITNNSTMCINTNVFNPHISDHSAVSTFLNIVKQRKQKTTFTYRDFKCIDQDNLYTELNECMANLTQTDNVHSAFSNLLQAIVHITDKHAPIRNKTIYKHEKVIKLSEHTKNQIFKRDQLYKLAVQYNTSAYKDSYRQQKKLVKKLILLYSRAFIQSSMAEKGIWPVLTALTKAKQKISIPFTPNEINDHFTDICNKPIMCYTNTVCNDADHDNKFNVEAFSAAELSYVWRKMKISKAQVRIV